LYVYGVILVVVFCTYFVIFEVSVSFRFWL